MACEDTDVHRIVAATRNIDTDSWNIDWKNLDKQVTRALPSLKREWNELAERVQKMPEWIRFQWLSMRAGVKSQLTTPAEPLTNEPTPKPTSLDTEFNFQVEETDDGFQGGIGAPSGRLGSDSARARFP
ncbi:hypothetical protein OS493_021238 [Desmophyllum pertusum]|uniref:Uncharacterized protein n=1 Tax=Desmophyllum pertusum TaxID=174260 RepID=A0A9W9ZN52_9CNID|nr:hypothetical protein OS493_021238 [Desmophyllum pertusum]